MRLERVVAGPLDANTYVLRAPRSCLVVDPGGCEVLRALEGCGGITVLITHGHFDHVQGLGCIEGADEVVAHRHAPTVYQESLRLASAWGLSMEPVDFKPTRPLEGDTRLELAGVTVEALYTPGHSPDHMVYYVPAERAVFTGDLLFRGTVGNWELPGGDRGLIAASLRRLVSDLPPDAKVLPGHGEDTTIGRELRENPLLKALLGMG